MSLFGYPKYTKGKKKKETDGLQIFHFHKLGLSYLRAEKVPSQEILLRKLFQTFCCFQLGLACLPFKENSHFLRKNLPATHAGKGKEP